MGFFPRLVRTESKVDPEGLPRVLSHLTLALRVPWLIPLGSFRRWTAHPALTPRTSGILATSLVRTEGKVETHRESPRVLLCLTLVLLAVGGGFVWLGL